MLDQQVVLEVEGIEKRHTINARAQAFDFSLDFLDIAEVVRFFLFEACQFVLGFAQFCPAAARQGDTPGMGRAQGADDVDP
ncbi:hypothetical protein D3C84_875220 [compost metagenome]